jgi:hypothetical protein
MKVIRPGLRRAWSRWLRYWYYRLIRLQSSSEAIARGLAVGVFAGLFPFFGLQTLMGVALAFLVRGNKLMAAAGTWISNPLTDIPIFLFNFQVGQWLLSRHQEPLDFTAIQSWNSVLELGTEIASSLLLGSLVMGTGLGILSYFLGLWFVRTMRQRRLIRRKRLN